MDLSVKTKPGYKVFSQSFIAVFIAGNRKELEEDNNWHDLMMHLANAFEKQPRDMMTTFGWDVGLQAAVMWILISILDVRDVRIQISNEKLSENQGDKFKAVFLVHLDHWSTDKHSTLIFEIKKEARNENASNTCSGNNSELCFKEGRY